MKSSKKFYIIALLLLLVPFFSWMLSNVALAAAPTITITPLEAPVDTNENYCLAWEASGTEDETKDLAVAFYYDDADANRQFDLSQLTFNEVTLYYDSPDCGTTQGGNYEARTTESWPGTASNGIDAVAIIPAGWIPGYRVVSYSPDDDLVINLGDNISIGVHQVAGNSVKTPLEADNYKIVMEQIVRGSTTEVDWMDVQLLYIGGANKVEINATVDPTLSLNVVETGSDTTQTACSLSTFNKDNLNTCAYRLKVSTNATGGYTAYIKENDQFKNAAGDLFAYIGIDHTLNAGTAEYGVATTTSGLDISQLDDADSSGTRNADDCTYIGTPSNDVNSSNFSALSANDQSIAAYTSQVSNEYTTVCHGSSIAGSTPAGVYTNIVYLTIVANF